MSPAAGKRYFSDPEELREGLLTKACNANAPKRKLPVEQGARRQLLAKTGAQTARMVVAAHAKRGSRAQRAVRKVRFGVWLMMVATRCCGPPAMTYCSAGRCLDADLDSLKA